MASGIPNGGESLLGMEQQVAFALFPMYLQSRSEQRGISTAEQKRGPQRHLPPLC
jgi:hypothetical protein